MSRVRLRDLGIDLPLLPTTAVGSFPKSDALVQARRRFVRGAISRAELDDHARQATESWIRVQERLGLDVLVDGEMYRGDMVTYFAESMGGFAPGGLVRSYGNRYYRKPVIIGEVKWMGPITVSWWEFAQSLTTKPVKGMLTGPYTLMDWSFVERYPDRRTTCMALARELRRELEELIGAGARIVQIDEPALSVRREELLLAIEALHIVTDDLPAYFIAHACYGAFETIYPGMLELPVHNLDLAISHSSLDLLRIFEKDPFSKDMSVGVLDVHSHEIEPRAEVLARIRRATRLLGSEAIWISPDCGLKTRTAAEAETKLERMTDATREVRRELALGVGLATPRPGSGSP